MLNPTFLGYAQRLNDTELPALPLPLTHPLVQETFAQLFGHYTRSASASQWSLLKACKPTPRYLRNSSTLNCTHAVDPSAPRRVSDGQRFSEPPQREWICHDANSPDMWHKWNSTCEVS